MWWQIALWSLLGLFVLLLAALLLLRLQIILEYDGTLHTTVKVLWFRFPIELTKILRQALGIGKPPPEPEPPQEPQEKKEEAPAPPKKSPLGNLYEKEGVLGILDLLGNVVNTLNRTARMFLRHFIINRLNVQIMVAGDDAAMTARKYGRVAAAYYPMIGVIRNGMTVKHYEEQIYPDYLANVGEGRMYLHMSVRVVFLLGTGLVAVKTFLINIWKNNQYNKKQRELRRQNKAVKKQG